MQINGDQPQWVVFDKTHTTFIRHQNTWRTDLCMGEIDVMLKRCGIIVIYIDIFLDDDDDFVQTNSMQNDDTNTEKES